MNAKPLRENSRIKKYLGPYGTSFLEDACGAIDQLLPHVKVSKWVEVAYDESGVRWDSRQKALVILIGIGRPDGKFTRAVQATVQRRVPNRTIPIRGLALDSTEREVCDQVVRRLGEVLGPKSSRPGVEETLDAVSSAFSEQVVARCIAKAMNGRVQIAQILRELRRISGETYENKSLSFGCLVDPSKSHGPKGIFPERLLELKRFKAMSDGYRTAYIVGKGGSLVGFEDIHFSSEKAGRVGYAPEWCEHLASRSRDGRVGIALAKSGDILVLRDGSLKFAYRYGKWRYWNHLHIVNILKSAARGSRVSPSVVGDVVRAIYRASLDISFRRTGGLFVVLRSSQHLGKIVRSEDKVGGRDRDEVSAAFDACLGGQRIQSLPRRVVAELGGLDGAVVVEKGGRLLSYGAVLKVSSSRGAKRSEGSRTKAAIAASRYGVAVKISSDGDITLYEGGKVLMAI